MTVIAPSFIHQSVYSVCLWVLCFKCVCIYISIYCFTVRLVISLSYGVPVGISLLYAPVLPPSFCPSVRISMVWFSPALVPDAVQVWGSCSRLPPHCSSLCPAPVAQPVPGSTALCHPHPVGNLSPTQPWHWQHTPLSLSLSFSYPLSPLLSSPVLSSPWPQLSSLISIIKQKLVNVSDARWLRHPATGPLAQHERTHKHLRKTHTHSLVLRCSHLHTRWQIQHSCWSVCSEFAILTSFW